MTDAMHAAKWSSHLQIDKEVKDYHTSSALPRIPFSCACELTTVCGAIFSSMVGYTTLLLYNIRIRFCVSWFSIYLYVLYAYTTINSMRKGRVTVHPAEKQRRKRRNRTNRQTQTTTRAERSN
jgi:hypothetical protein